MRNDDQNITEPADESNFLEEMRQLFEVDPDEALERLAEEGYSEDDLEL